jgi:hypothetical protein
VGHYQVACPKCKRKAETPTPPLRLLYEDGDHWSTIILESKNEEWSKTIPDKVFTYRSERRTDGGYLYTCTYRGEAESSVSGQSSYHLTREQIELMPGKFLWRCDSCGL